MISFDLFDDEINFNNNLLWEKILFKSRYIICADKNIEKKYYNNKKT